MIRFADSADINIIHSLAHKIWWPAYKDILSTEQIEVMLEEMYSVSALKKQFEEGVLFILNEESYGPTGFASWSAADQQESLYKIHKLYILPSEQGRNIGRKLLTFICSYVKDRGAKTLELNVNRNNPALNFYKKLGFEIFRETDIAYHGFWLNDYVMRYTIPDQEGLLPF